MINLKEEIKIVEIDSRTEIPDLQKESKGSEEVRKEAIINKPSDVLITEKSENIINDKTNDKETETKDAHEVEEVIENKVTTLQDKLNLKKDVSKEAIIIKPSGVLEIKESENTIKSKINDKETETEDVHESEDVMESEKEAIISKLSGDLEIKEFENNIKSKTNDKEDIIESKTDDKKS